MAKGEKQRDFPTRKFDCPEELFGEGKFIVRRRRIKTRVIRQMEAEIKPPLNFVELYGLLSQYTVEWNLDDVDSGEPLPQPHGNTDVFDELDFAEQLIWIINTVFLNPPNFPKGR